MTDDQDPAIRRMFGLEESPHPGFSVGDWNKITSAIRYVEVAAGLLGKLDDDQKTYEILNWLLNAKIELKAVIASLPHLEDE